MPRRSDACPSAIKMLLQQFAVNQPNCPRAASHHELVVLRDDKHDFAVIGQGADPHSSRRINQPGIENELCLRDGFAIRFGDTAAFPIAVDVDSKNL